MIESDLLTIGATWTFRNKCLKTVQIVEGKKIVQKKTYDWRLIPLLTLLCVLLTIFSHRSLMLDMSECTAHLLHAGHCHSRHWRCTPAQTSMGNMHDEQRRMSIFSLRGHTTWSGIENPYSAPAWASSNIYA